MNEITEIADETDLTWEQAARVVCETIEIARERNLVNEQGQLKWEDCIALLEEVTGEKQVFEPTLDSPFHR